jgi:hypothetical protein
MALGCPVCSTISIFERRTPEVDLWRCPSCGHCFSDINSIKALEEYSPEYYEVTHRNFFKNPNLTLFKTISQFIMQNKPNSSLIDVGCGNGNFLKFIHKKNRQFNNEVQHLGEQKGRCYPKCLCQRTTNILPWTKENS